MRIIAGKWKGRRVAPVAGARVRPTAGRVREAWMSMLGPRLPGAVVADLFAGSGALGLEALSRGASHVTFVERSPRAARVLARNIRDLGAGPASAVVRGDALLHLRGLAGDRRYDLVLADPPYREGLAAALLALFAKAPFASELWIEHDAGESMPETPRSVRRRYGRTALTGAAAAPP